MAYQTHGRDPLLDSNMQAALERRGRELIGIGLVVLGLMAAMMIVSYSPDDPNWMVATDAPVQNWLGRMGASLAAPLFMIIGWGAFGIAILFTVWGLRVGFNWGKERAVSRLIFAPIALALASVYAATLAPAAGWSHSFGLGGLFGDTVLLVILEVIPGTAALGAKLISLIAGAAILGLGAFVLGFTWPEIYRLSRWMVLGLVLIYAYAMKALGQGARMGARATSVAAQATSTVAHNIHAQRQAHAQACAEQKANDEQLRAQHLAKANAHEEAEKQRVAQVIRANRAAGLPAASVTMQPEPEMGFDEPDPVLDSYYDEPTVNAEPKSRLRGLVPSLLKREPETVAMPAPELVSHEPNFEDELPETSEDRLRSKIAKAIRTRSRVEPPLTAAYAAKTNPAPQQQTVASTAPLREEPSMTRSARAPAPTYAPETIPAAQPFESVPTEAALDLSAFVPPAPSEIQNPVAKPAAPAFEPELPKEMVDIPTALSDVAEIPEESVANMATPHSPIPEVTLPPIPVPEPKKVVQHPTKKKMQPSVRAKAEAQPDLKFEDTRPLYEHPPLSLLENPIQIERHHLSDESLEENARMLESVLDDYGVKGEIVSVRPGPVVTMYELEPAPGLKASRVIGLSDDIARSMSALSARVSTVPGRSVIGIELPNVNREKVVLREMLSGRDFGDTNMRLPLALGKDIGGDPVVANLAKMPHLLIAGTTGSGKSVAINTMILSLLYKLTPEECRLIMIDPKMLELSVYDGIPHLLSPVVTDPKKAVVALKWTVGEMEERYRKMSKMGVRNIEGYNSRVADALEKDEMFSRTVQTGFDDESGEPIFETEEFAPEKLPYIVVIVDEMADLMMVAGKEIEACIQRLAQMARASGIHLIMATQRPSVDVITGTIKANFPTRISFQVTSKVDSRTILGEMGAEQLLGMGDMLYMAGGAKISRVHGPFCSDEEVEEIVNFLKGYGPPDYIGGVVDGPSDGKESDIDLVLGLGGNTDQEDAMYDTAVAIVMKDRKCSTSYIQRKLAIGYNKAARLVEQMEDQGIVSPANHVGKREILVPEQ